MNVKLKSFLLWILAFVLTVAAAVYQRTTGPTYPVRGTITIGDQTISYRLIRTYDGEGGAPVKITVSDPEITGMITLRRYKSHDEWHTKPLVREGDQLVGYLPPLDMAGKIMYKITLIHEGKHVILNEKPAILRYKGFVPRGVLWFHIITIFLAMLFSTRTAFEVIFKLKYTYLYTWLTVIFLMVGGMILGPVVQKYAFDAYWTGWPYGHDMTDNKSLLAFIFWLVAIGYQLWDREKKKMAVIAAVVLLVVYLIPHSVMGSEIDYTQEEKPGITEMN